MRQQRSRRIKWCFVGVIALVALASAQTAQAQKQTPSAGITVEQRYDDNVLLLGQSDFVTKVEPRVGYRLELAGIDLSLKYQADFLHFAEQKADDSVGHRATFNAKINASKRLTLRLIDKFAYAYDPATIDRPAVVQLDGAILLNYVYTGLEYAITRRVALAVDYQSTLARFANPTLVSGDEHDFTGAVWWRITRLDALGFGARSQVFLANGDYAGASVGPYVGLRRRITRGLRVEVEGGPLVYFSQVLTLPPGGVGGMAAANLVDERATDGAKLTWRAGGALIYEDPRTLAAARYGRDLLGGGGLDAVLWGEYVGADVRRRLWRGLHITAAVRYYLSGEAPNADAALTGIIADGGISYRLPNGLNFGIGGAHMSQDLPGATHTARFALHRNIAAIRLGYSFAERIDGLGREVP